MDRAIARLKLAADAGADVLYPVGRHDDAVQRRLTSELPLPVNAIGIPDQDDPASFGPLGVARVSFGPFFQMALSNQANEILGAIPGTIDAALEEAKSAGVQVVYLPCHVEPDRLTPVF